MKGAERIGFSLREISGLLSLRVDPRSTCDDVKRRAEVKSMGIIEEKMEALERMKKALVRWTASCRGIGPKSECPILESPNARNED